MRNTYQLCNNGTLRVMYANGMSISFHSEPHVLAGTVTPTIGRCNISLPMENGLNSIEWRLRKDQIKGKVTVFGRKLRVSAIQLYNHKLWAVFNSNILWHLISFKMWTYGFIYTSELRLQFKACALVREWGCNSVSLLCPSYRWGHTIEFYSRPAQFLSSSQMFRNCC